VTEEEAYPAPERRRAGADPAADPEGRYEIAEEISRGGMGRIRVAHDRKLDRVVAVKQLLNDTPHARMRFEREAKITARLQHPAIIPIYDATFAAGGAPSYSMRLVAGRSLDAVIDEATTLEARLALLPNVIAVADAIAYAHSRSIIHRDLKPANVLIGDFGETVVIDWGLAKDLTLAPDELDGVPADASEGPPGLTVTGAVLGTPVYMAPEQARGARVDERADVYALGAMLYHLLSAQPPAPSGTESTREAPTIPPVAPVPLPRGVPLDLVAIVTKAMAGDPAARYPTARELAGDLRRFQTGQLVSAHRYGAGMLVRRFARRHRAALVATGLLVTALAIGGGFSVRRIQAERDVADTRLVAAEDILQFIVSDLRDRLQALGKLELLESAGDRVDRYYRRIDAADRAEGEAGRQELARRIAARQLVGEVALAKGNSDGALVAFKEQRELAQRLGRDDLLAGSEQSLGDLLTHRGDPAGAIAALDRALGHARRTGDASLQSSVQLRLGEAYQAKGDLDAARSAYRAARELAIRAAAEQPSSVERQCRVAESQGKLADILQRVGDEPGALVEFRSARDGLLPVVARHPEDTRAMRALSVLHSRIGEVLRGQGDLRGALEAFRQSQALGLTLAAREPLNQRWQRDVGVDHQTVASVLREQEDDKAAAAELHEARVVYERIAAAEPSSIDAQQSLASVASDEALQCTDHVCGARAYRGVLELYRALVARDPTSAELALRLLHTQLQLLSQLQEIHAPDALAVARETLVSAVAWARMAPDDSEGPLLVAHAKLLIARCLVGTPGGAAETRQLAGEALAAYRAVSADTLRSEFHELTTEELASAEALAR